MLGCSAIIVSIGSSLGYCATIVYDQLEDDIRLAANQICQEWTVRCDRKVSRVSRSFNAVLPLGVELMYLIISARITSKVMGGLKIWRA